MNIDWKEFEADILRQCTEGLDEDSLTHAIFLVAVEAATVAIQKYHDLLNPETAESSSLNL